jgi:serine/threonine protein kinase
MDGGSLADIICVYQKAKIEPLIDERILAKVALQILCGLSYMHSNNQIHRDIKPGNILTNIKGQVKISDFGISKELIDKEDFSKTFIGTRSYMSPERVEGENYSFVSDIWSFGLVMYELATAQFPYKQKSHIELRQQFIEVGSPKLPERYSSDFR